MSPALASTSRRHSAWCCSFSCEVNSNRTSSTCRALRCCCTPAASTADRSSASRACSARVSAAPPEPKPQCSRREVWATTGAPHRTRHPTRRLHVHTGAHRHTLPTHSTHLQHTQHTQHTPCPATHSSPAPPAPTLALCATPRLLRVPSPPRCPPSSAAAPCCAVAPPQHPAVPAALAPAQPGPRPAPQPQPAPVSPPSTGEPPASPPCVLPPPPPPLLACAPRRRVPPPEPAAPETVPHAVAPPDCRAGGRTPLACPAGDAGTPRRRPSRPA